MLSSQQLLKLEEMGLMTQVKRMECKDHLKDLFRGDVGIFEWRSKDRFIKRSSSI